MDISRSRSERSDYYGSYVVDLWVCRSGTHKQLLYSAPARDYTLEEAEALFRELEMGVEHRLAPGLLRP